MKQDLAILGVVFVFILTAVFCMSWGIIHGVLEFGQYVEMYDYEPIWTQTIFITLVFNIIGSLFRGGSK